jgi:hypothetical protein
MIPSNKWFPSTLQERAAWFANFNTNFQVEGVALGFTPAELLAIAHESETYTYLADATLTIEAYLDAFRQYRKIVTEGDIGDPTPDFPSDISLTLPNSMATGMFERLDNLVKRIRVAPNYTDEIGALLGIIPSSGGGTPEADLKPLLKASAQPGNIVEVKFTRGDTDGIVIEYQIDTETDWTLAGKFFKSPAALEIAAKEGNLPRAVRLRARFLKGNDAVGLNSDTVNVTTTP